MHGLDSIMARWWKRVRYWVGLETINVRFGLPGGLAQVEGAWRPNHSQRDAAWELYVELVTRIATVELPEDRGSLREALTSLHSLSAQPARFFGGMDHPWRDEKVLTYP